MRCLAGLFLLAASLLAGTAADLARAIRENSFDRDECYRVRDLTLTKEDIRIYLTDGHLIFSKPVAGRRIAAVFTADVEGGDGEVILLPPDRAERRSLAAYIDSPNLDEHFRTARVPVHRRRIRRAGAQFAEQSRQQEDSRDRRRCWTNSGPPCCAISATATRPVWRSTCWAARRAPPGLFAGLLQQPQTRQFRRGLRPHQPGTDPGRADRPRATTASTSIPGPAFAARSARQSPAPPPGRHRGQRLPHRGHAQSRPVAERGDAREGQGRAWTAWSPPLSTSPPQMEVTAVTVDGQPGRSAAARIAARQRCRAAATNSSWWCRPSRCAPAASTNLSSTTPAR